MTQELLTQFSNSHKNQLGRAKGQKRFLSNVLNMRLTLIKIDRYSALQFVGEQDNSVLSSWVQFASSLWAKQA
jgi:hypothetical protein